MHIKNWYERSLRLVKNIFQKGFFHLLSIRFFCHFMGFGSLLIVSKLLNPAEFGMLKIFQSYADLLAVIAAAGLNGSLMKFCSETQQREERKYLLKRSVQNIFFSSFFCVVGAIYIVNCLSSSNDQAFRQWICLYFTMTPFAVCYQIFVVYLQANKELKTMACIQSLMKIISIGLIVGMTWLYGLSGYIYSIFFSMIISLLFILKKIGASFWFTKKMAMPRKFYFLAITSLLSGFISILGRYADIFILDQFIKDREEIGYYAMAAMFAAIGTQVNGTVQSFLTPYFSEKRYQSEWFQHQLWRCQRNVIFVSGIVSTAVYCLVSGLIQFYYGVSYEKVLLYTGILLIACFFKSMYAVIGIAQFALVKEHYNAMVALFTLITKFILAYYMMNAYGIVGVAVSQGIAEFLTVPLAFMSMRYSLKKEFIDKELP